MIIRDDLIDVNMVADPGTLLEFEIFLTGPLDPDEEVEYRVDTVNERQDFDFFKLKYEDRASNIAIID